MNKTATKGITQEMRAAAIDIGTNTIKCLTAEHTSTGWVWLSDQHYATRIGEGLHATGQLSSQAIARNVTVLTDLVHELQQLGISKILAVGTMGLRQAANREVFLQLVNDSCGLTIELISGERESQLAFRAGSEVAAQDGWVAVCDIGGGSSEVAVGQQNQLETAVSMPLGGVSLTEKFLLTDPPTTMEVAAMELFIRQIVVANSPRTIPIATAVVMGGTAVTLAAIAQSLPQFDASKLHGYTLRRTEIERQYQELIRLNRNERKMIVGMDPTRADILPAGVAILRELMSFWRLDSVTVCTHGIRHAILLELVPDSE